MDLLAFGCAIMPNGLPAKMGTRAATMQATQTSARSFAGAQAARQAGKDFELVFFSYDFH